MTNKSVQFICPKCNQTVEWNTETDRVFCKYCYRWIKFKDLKNPRVEVSNIHAKKTIEQLTMFK